MEARNVTVGDRRVSNIDFCAATAGILQRIAPERESRVTGFTGEDESERKQRESENIMIKCSK